MHCRILHPGPVTNFAVCAELERVEPGRSHSFCEWRGGGYDVAGFPCLVGSRLAER